MPTNFENKAGILADLWINFRDDEVLKDFIDYNDIGLPLAYFTHTQLATPSEEARVFIDETFNLLCSSLGIDEDGEYTTLNEMFDKNVE